MKYEQIIITRRDIIEQFDREREEASRNGRRAPLHSSKLTRSNPYYNSPNFFQFSKWWNTNKYHNHSSNNSIERERKEEASRNGRRAPLARGESRKSRRPRGGGDLDIGWMSQTSTRWTPIGGYFGTLGPLKCAVVAATFLFQPPLEPRSLARSLVETRRCADTFRATCARAAPQTSKLKLKSCFSIIDKSKHEANYMIDRIDPIVLIDLRIWSLEFFASYFFGGRRPTLAVAMETGNVWGKSFKFLRFPFLIGKN